MLQSVESNSGWVHKNGIEYKNRIVDANNTRGKYSQGLIKMGQVIYM